MTTIIGAKADPASDSTSSVGDSTNETSDSEPDGERPYYARLRDYTSETDSNSVTPTGNCN